MGSYRYRNLIEGLYTLWKPYRSPIYPNLNSPPVVSLGCQVSSPGRAGGMFQAGAQPESVPFGVALEAGEWLAPLSSFDFSWRANVWKIL